METKNKTAVDLLREKLLNEFGFTYSDNIHQEFKELEKEQIIKSWNDSHVSMMSGEQYYKETYEQ
jgi:hypothetical protein